MLKFDQRDGKVAVDPKSLTIGALKEVWNCDKTSTKEKATKILTYIHLTSQIDPDAPFAQSSYSEVELLSARNTWPDRKNPEAVVRWLNIYYSVPDRIRAYIKAYETPDQRSERVFNKKIDQLQELLDSTNPVIKENDDKGKITFTSNTSFITKIMGELSKLMDERDKLKARIKKKSQEERQLFGSKSESLLEKRHSKDGRPE